jgi:hypothetical protein
MRIHAKNLAFIRGMTVNTIEKDKIPTLNTAQSRSGKQAQSGARGEGQIPASTGERMKKDDSLSLSTTGKLLNQPASKSETARSTPPETREQAEALAAKIRQHFTHSGTQALHAYSLGDGNNLGNLLQSAPA